MSITKDIRLLAATLSPDVANCIRTAVDEIGEIDLDLRAEPLARLMPLLLGEQTPDVLFIDINLSDEQVLDLLAGVIRHTVGRMAVLVTAPATSLDGVRRLMRLGVADFVPQPVAATDLQSALTIAVSKLGGAVAAPGRVGRVAAFLRSCGGVGATTIAVQTAVELTRNRRKLPAPAKVCLIDFDLQFGNAALSLDIGNAPGLLRLLESPDRIDADFLKRAMAPHTPSGVDVLAAPPKIVPFDALTPGLAGKILGLARQHYDHIIVDLPHGWTAWTPEVLSCSDLIALVAELNVTAIQRTRQHLALLSDQHLDDIPLVLVMSRVENEWFGHGSRRQRAETALGRRIDFVVHEDASTANAARDRGVPPSEVSRNSKMVKDICRLAQHIGQPASVARAA